MRDEHDESISAAKDTELKEKQENIEHKISERIPYVKKHNTKYQSVVHMQKDVPKNTNERSTHRK